MEKHQVIGLIEMDPCLRGGQIDDNNVGETLSRLRRAPLAADVDDADVDGLEWEISALPNTDDAVVSATLEADLGQLHADLEYELATFVQRLMVVS